MQKYNTKLSIRNRRKNADQARVISQLVDDETIDRTATVVSTTGKNSDHESFNPSDSDNYHETSHLTSIDQNNNNSEVSGENDRGAMLSMNMGSSKRLKALRSNASSSLGSNNGKASGARLTTSRMRSSYRLQSTSGFDNDHDGDIDCSDNEDDNSCYNSDNSGNDLNTNAYDNAQQAAVIGNLDRYRQDEPVFLRLRRQQKMLHVEQQQDLRVSDDKKVTALDENRSVTKNNNPSQPEKLAQNSGISNNSQCSESGTVIGRSILFLRNYLSRLIPSTDDQQISDLCEKSHSTSSENTTDAIELHDKNIEENQQKPNMLNNNNRYEPIHSFDEIRGPRKLSTKIKLRECQRLGGPNGYSKLSHHHHYGTSKPQSKAHELKRLLLLLVIICACCVLLWKLHQVLTDEYNYLGTVETASELGKFRHYAVSTDAKPCAKVGEALLAKGGSAVDAAIGTLLCMGIIIPNSLGLGGGCLMTIYDSKRKKAIVIDGRETAPDYVTEDMFSNDSIQASRGPLSIGVPGELAAYWRAHQLFGRLNWSDLFDDSIRMAEEGVPMVEHLSYALRDRSHSQYITPPLRRLYLNKDTGEYLAEGDIIIQKQLANTLKRIRDFGAQDFYGGLTGQRFINDLKQQGGKLTMENLMKYEALVKEPLKFNLEKDLILYTQPLPGSGIVLSIILKIMKELGYYKNIRPQTSFDSSSLYYHRLAEAFKFAYAQRAGLEDMPDDPQRLELLMRKLLSENFIKEAASKIDNQTHDYDHYGGIEYFKADHGTAHVSVLDAEGNAAAVTSSVNLYFGSGLVSPSTGITYNDVMDDFVSPNVVNKFELPPSKYNRIRPGKRPLSSMAPSVFTDADGNVKLIIGASGGSKITTAIATVSLRNCFLDEDIKTAIDGPRIHHQFLPNKISHEKNFPKDLLHSLVDRGHIVEPIVGRSSVVMAVASDQVNNSTRYITANSDYRKGGAVGGF